MEDDGRSGGVPPSAGVADCDLHYVGVGKLVKSVCLEKKDCIFLQDMSVCVRIPPPTQDNHLNHYDLNQYT